MDMINPLPVKENGMNMFKKTDFLNPEENIHIRRNPADNPQETHCHEFAELVYTISGQVDHVVDGVTYTMSRGDLLFINYGQTHAFVPRTEGEYFNILLTPTFFSEALINSENMYEIFSISMFCEFESPKQELIKPYVSFSGKELIEVEFIINRMRDEFEKRQSGYRSVLSGYMRVLFSLLLRKLNNAASPEQERFVRQITPEVLEYIDSHISDRISLGEIAEHCFYNPAYFSRVFKQYCGKTLSAYIRDKRMEKAAGFLSGDKPASVSQVAVQCGYSDSRLFYRHFREYFGITPGEYTGKKKPHKSK